VVIERFLALWRGLLDYSRLTAGCAVIAVTVAANDDDLLDHAGTIFEIGQNCSLSFVKLAAWAANQPDRSP